MTAAATEDSIGMEDPKPTLCTDGEDPEESWSSDFSDTEVDGVPLPDPGSPASVDGPHQELHHLLLRNFDVLEAKFAVNPSVVRIQKSPWTRHLGQEWRIVVGIKRVVTGFAGVQWQLGCFLQCRRSQDGGNSPLDASRSEKSKDSGNDEIAATEGREEAKRATVQQQPSSSLLPSGVPTEYPEGVVDVQARFELHVPVLESQTPVQVAEPLEWRKGHTFTLKERLELDGADRGQWVGSASAEIRRILDRTSDLEQNLMVRVQLYRRPPWFKALQDMVQKHRLQEQTRFRPSSISTAAAATAAGHGGVGVEDSRQQQLRPRDSGFVGIVNQGATCYMNSYLQILYHLPVFRGAILELPTQEECQRALQSLQEHLGPSPPRLLGEATEPQIKPSVSLAVQQLFYRLQTSPVPVNTQALTSAFGWVLEEVFEQRDVQEFSRIFSDALERHMRGTSVEGIVNELFEADCEAYRECVNVDYRSNTRETYHDLSLNVKDYPGLLESLRGYVKVELLTGENQYRTDKYGLQDAKIGTRFLRFPPILQVQLKRFDFIQHFQKVDSRFSFPTVLDLSEFVQHQKMPEADALDPERHIYLLHTVLTHSGGINGGHYYSFIRPFLDSSSGRPYAANPWFKFDDDIVRRVGREEVVEKNFGGPGTIAQAYYLVYVRKSWTQYPIPDSARRAVALEKAAVKDGRGHVLPPDTASTRRDEEEPTDRQDNGGTTAPKPLEKTEAPTDNASSGKTAAERIGKEIVLWRRSRRAAHRKQASPGSSQTSPPGTMERLSSATLNHDSGNRRRRKMEQVKRLIQALRTEKLPQGMNRWTLPSLISQRPVKPLTLPIPEHLMELDRSLQELEEARAREDLERQRRTTIPIWLDGVRPKFSRPFRLGLEGSDIWKWWDIPSVDVRNLEQGSKSGGGGGGGGGQKDVSAPDAPHPKLVVSIRQDFPSSLGIASLLPLLPPLGVPPEQWREHALILEGLQQSSAGHALALPTQLQLTPVPDLLLTGVLKTELQVGRIQELLAGALDGVDRPEDLEIYRISQDTHSAYRHLRPIFTKPDRELQSGTPLWVRPAGNEQAIQALAGLHRIRSWTFETDESPSSASSSPPLSGISLSAATPPRGSGSRKRKSPESATAVVEAAATDPSSAQEQSASKRIRLSSDSAEDGRASDRRGPGRSGGGWFPEDEAETVIRALLDSLSEAPPILPPSPSHPSTAPLNLLGRVRQFLPSMSAAQQPSSSPTPGVGGEAFLRRTRDPVLILIKVWELPEQRLRYLCSLRIHPSRWDVEKLRKLLGDPGRLELENPEEARLEVLWPTPPGKEVQVQDDIANLPPGACLVVTPKVWTEEQLSESVQEALLREHRERWLRESRLHVIGGPRLRTWSRNARTYLQSLWSRSQVWAVPSKLDAELERFFDNEIISSPSSTSSSSTLSPSSGAARRKNSPQKEDGGAWLQRHRGFLNRCLSWSVDLRRETGNSLRETILDLDPRLRAQVHGNLEPLVLERITAEKWELLPRTEPQTLAKSRKFFLQDETTLAIQKIQGHRFQPLQTRSPDELRRLRPPAVLSHSTLSLVIRVPPAPFPPATAAPGELGRTIKVLLHPSEKTGDAILFRIRPEPLQEYLDAQGRLSVPRLQIHIVERLRETESWSKEWSAEGRRFDEQEDPGQQSQSTTGDSELAAWRAGKPFPVDSPALLRDIPEEVRIICADSGRLKNPEIPLARGCLNRSSLPLDIPRIRCIPWNSELEALQAELLRAQPPQVPVKVRLPSSEMEQEKEQMKISTGLPGFSPDPDSMGMDLQEETEEEEEEEEEENRMVGDDRMQIVTGSESDAAEAKRQLVWITKFEREDRQTRASFSFRPPPVGMASSRPSPVILERGTTVGGLKRQLAESIGTAPSQLGIGVLKFERKTKRGLRRITPLEDEDLDLSRLRFGCWEDHSEFLGYEVLQPSDPDEEETHELRLRTMKIL